MTITLDKIIQYKKEELASTRRKVTLQDVKQKADDAAPALHLLERFKKEETNIIAEIKKASPSAGIIKEGFHPEDLALIYQDHGAKAISILTDEIFFKGSLKYLSQVKKKVKLPCLRKDFTLDEYHVFEARGAGADAVLLIVAVLDPIQLRDYYDLSCELGMTVLVEIHNEEELEKILFLIPEIIGINNRNLKTFEVDLKNSLDLIRKIPKSIKKISESGIKTVDDIQKLKLSGFDGFLIGETLMKEKDVGKKLSELVGSV